LLKQTVQGLHFTR